MSTLPTSNRQLPDHAILDHYNKQTYLGNSFVAVADAINLPLGSKETALMLLKNPIANISPLPIGLFQETRKAQVLTASQSAIFRYYLNPTVSGNGTAITPVNRRPAFSVSSIMNAYYSPTISGVAQVQTIDTVADVAGSLNNTYFLLSDVISTGVIKLWYLWFNVASGGTDPAISGRTGISVALSTGATANAVATAMRTALNALTTDFVATGATNHVIITSVTAGSSPVASDGAQPTGFTFHNTTPGSSAFGTFLEGLNTSNIIIESDLLVLDPGNSMLVTAQSSGNNTVVSSELHWYEL